MEDAAGFFANVFGGERFRDYVSLLYSLFCLAVCSQSEAGTLLAVVRRRGRGLAVGRLTTCRRRIQHTQCSSACCTIRTAPHRTDTPLPRSARYH